MHTLLLTTYKHSLLHQYVIVTPVYHCYLRCWLLIELNGIWVRAFPGQMHLGLRTGPLCPIFCTKLEEPCSFSKVPDGPYT